ncbi:MAG: hypothetical protein ACE5JZ_02755 [Kiloniellales bacterium]
MRRFHPLALLFVIGFTAVVLGYYHDRFWWGPDDGAMAHVAERILAGEVLNGDVQEIRPGYASFANALALWLFGHDFLSLRYPLAVLSFVQTCLIFLLLVSRGALVATAAAVSMTALSFVQYLNPQPHWYCLFLFVVIVCGLAWIPRDARWRLELLGFLLITLLLFRQLTGVLVAIGLLTYLLYEAGRGANGMDRLLARGLLAVMAGGLAVYLIARSDPLAWLLFGIWPVAVLFWACLTVTASNAEVIRMVRRLGVGGALAALPLVLYQLLNGSYAGWFDDTVMTALALNQLEFFGRLSYGLFLAQGLRQIIALDSIAGVLNGFFWASLPLLPMVSGFLVLRHLLRQGAEDPALHPLAFLAPFYAIVSVHFQIAIYLFYSAGISLAVLLWMTSRGPGWRRPLPVALACVLSAIALYYHAAQPVSRGLKGILVGQRIDLVPGDGLPSTSLWVTARDLRLYTHLVGLIRHEVAPDETILAIPMNPELYFLSGRWSRFRFYSTAYGIRSDDDLRNVLETLARRPPKLIFHRPDDKYNTIYSAKLMEFVKQRYQVLETDGGFVVYRRPRTGLGLNG